MHLTGTPKMSVHFSLPTWVRSAVTFKAVCNLEPVYFSSSVLSRPPHCTTPRAPFTLQNASVPSTPTRCAVWKVPTRGSVTLLSVPARQTPFCEKALSASACLDHLCLASLALSLISLLLEAFPVSPTLFLSSRITLIIFVKFMYWDRSELDRSNFYSLRISALSFLHDLGQVALLLWASSACKMEIILPIPTEHQED